MLPYYDKDITKKARPSIKGSLAFGLHYAIYLNQSMSDLHYIRIYKFYRLKQNG